MLVHKCKFMYHFFYRVRIYSLLTRSDTLDKEILDLIEKVRDGDEIAFATLSETYANLIDGAVKRFAPSFGIDAESDGDIYGSDDLRQIAVVALYKAALTYDPENEGKNVSFGLFAKICVRNAMISALRKYKTEVKRIESAKESVKNTRISNRRTNKTYSLTCCL